MAKRRILIVDDEAGFTRLVKLNLEGTGRYEVRDAMDGASALETARAFHPDVVVLDVMMPGLDGGQVAEKLRTANEGRPLPIIFVSATNQAHAVQNLGRGDTACPFLSKPISLETLVACIEQQLAASNQGGQRDDDQTKARIDCGR